MSPSQSVIGSSTRTTTVSAVSSTSQGIAHSYANVAHDTRFLAANRPIGGHDSVASFCRSWGGTITVRATAADACYMTGHLQQTFRQWVRDGMPDPAPSFEALHDSSMYLPGDVIEILAAQRGLTDVRTYGQAVRQLDLQLPPLAV